MTTSTNTKLECISLGCKLERGGAPPCAKLSCGAPAFCAAAEIEAKDAASELAASRIPLGPWAGPFGCVTPEPEHLAPVEAVEASAFGILKSKGDSTEHQVEPDLASAPVRYLGDGLTACCKKPMVPRPGVVAVMWNEFSGVVQCHACGQIWAPAVGKLERQILADRRSRTARDILLVSFALVLALGLLYTAAAFIYGWPR